jgi:hypothetical protein
VNVGTLTIGDWVAARATRGLLECEYALFAPSDVLLATPIAGAGVREQGYLTTAAHARTRLETLGFTRHLQRRAFDAIASDLPSLVRASALAPAIAHVEAAEAFQGGIYDAKARRYQGVWFDLEAVARASELDIAFAMQLLHLAAALAETRDDAPVRLWTGGDEVPVSSRSFKRVAVDVADLRALTKLRRPLVSKPGPNEADIRSSIVDDLRARATVVNDPLRLSALASALVRARDAASPVVVVTDDLEVEPVPLIHELLSHREMLHGELHLREVAQFLTAMAERKVGVSELAMLAARAWLASGEDGYARYFARRVLEDTGAPEGTRLAATEILESTEPTHMSMLPPPRKSMQPAAIVILPDTKAQTRRAPPGASRPPMEATPLDEQQASRLRNDKNTEARIVVVETMSPPDGDEVRIRMTALARELAREYRLSYGTTLQTDKACIEAMQHHLRRRFAHAQKDARTSRMFDEELTQHGALLSEILVRTLGARWVDVSSPELGRWTMVVPPGTRVWPIGRVYRFFEQGQRESDLLAFYVELETAARAGR